MGNKRRINNRILVFLTVSTIFGIVFSSYDEITNRLTVLGIFLVFGFSLIFLLQKGESFGKYSKHLTIFILAGAFILGSTIGYAEKFVYEKVYQSRSGDFTGEVEEYVYGNIILKNLTIDGREIKGKVKLVADTGEYAEAGEILSFSGDLVSIPLFYDGSIKREYSSGIAYTADEEYEITGKNLCLKNRVKSYVKKAQIKMFDEHSSIAYAMTFGDTMYMDYSTLSLMREGGVGHIFAVSGLHIGVIFVFLKGIFRVHAKSSQKRKNIFYLISSLLLLVYIYLCDFSASSMRAFFMIEFTILSKVLRKNYDLLTSIAFVAFILMLYEPYIIFEIGFQLSFLAVLSICILSPEIEKLLKFKNRKIASTLAVTIGVTLMLIPASFYHFGYISTYSIPLNLIFVPVFSLCYIVNIVGLVLYAVLDMLNIEVLTFLFDPFFTKYFFDLVVNIFEYISNIPRFITQYEIEFLVVVGIYAVIFVFSTLLNFSKKTKTKISAVIMVLFLGLNFLAGDLSKTSIDFTVFEKDGVILVINADDCSYIFIDNTLKSVDASIAENDNVVIIIQGVYSENTIKVKGGKDVDVYAQTFDLKGADNTINLSNDFFKDDEKESSTIGNTGTVNKKIKSLWSFEDEYGQVKYNEGEVEYENLLFNIESEKVIIDYGENQYVVTVDYEKYSAYSKEEHRNLSFIIVEDKIYREIER